MGKMFISDAFSGSALRASFGNLTDDTDWTDEIAELADTAAAIVVERVQLLWGAADEAPSVVQIASALDLDADVIMSVDMTEDAAAGVEIDHSQGCCCSSCGMRTEDTITLEAAAEGEIPEGSASAEAFGTLQEMADYLSLGYWTDNATVSRKFNLTDTGTNAKSGVMHYNVTGYSNSGNAGTDLTGLSTERADLVRDVLDVYSAVLGITFVETTSSDVTVTDLFFKDNDSGAYASSYGFSNGIQYSYVNVATSWSGATSTYNDYTLQTIFHEIGHALGLGHQGFYNGSATFGVDETFGNDSWQASMMSYFSQTENTDVNATGAYLQTPMAVDWIALQDIYGDQSYGGTTYGTQNAFTGDTVYGFNTNITSAESNIWAEFANYADVTASTIIDADGIDTLDVSGYSADQMIDLTVSEPTATTATIMDIGGLTGNLTLAAGTVIENAVGGTGNDLIIGNNELNTLSGGDGDDEIRGGVGKDTILGDGGNDYLKGENGNDLMWGGEGDDELLGGNKHDQLWGDAGEDILKGGEGDDVLIGGLDYDRLFGNGGVDTFKFTSIDDSLRGNQLDRIRDFDLSDDLIDLSEMAGTTMSLTLDGSFAGGVASATALEHKGNTLVSVDLDGDLSWDFRVVVAGMQGLTVDHFVL